METDEKRMLRVRLITDGLMRNKKWDLLTPKEIGVGLEVLAEELVKIEPHEEAHQIRARFEKYGMQIPRVKQTVEDEGLCEQEVIEKNSDSGGVGLCSELPNACTQPMPVHPTGQSRAQTQQYENDRRFKQLGGTLKNIYPEDRAPNPLHVLAVRERETPRNPKDRRNATCVPGTTKVLLPEITPAPVGTTGSWTWRDSSYRRVPPAIAEAIREKFKQGWSKSKLAREFLLNRRTIIRICKASGEGS